MGLTAEKRYRVVEVLPNHRHCTIDSDLSLLTARTSVELFRHIDPQRKVVIEVSEDDETNSDDVGENWSFSRAD